MEIRESIDRIVQANLKLGRTAFVESLRKGASPATLKRLTSKLGKLPAGLKAALALHDGCNVPEDAPVDPYTIVPGFYWQPAKDLADSLEDFPQLAGHYPIFASAGGDFYGVEVGGTRAAVIYFPVEDDPVKTYDSVETMFETIAVCIEEGACAVDKGYGGLRDDLEKVRPVAARLNPRSRSFWTGERTAVSRRTKKAQQSPARPARSPKRPSAPPAGSVSQEYPIAVDYSISVKKMIEAGHYDNDPNARPTGPRAFPSFSAMYPLANAGIEETDAFLVDLGITNRNARRLLGALGLEPARFEHLLAFGARYPDVQRHYRIAAVGSVWIDKEGKVGGPGTQYAPILFACWPDRRELLLCSWNDCWKNELPLSRFLAVRSHEGSAAKRP